jgi:hypothetical protein
LPAGTAQTVPSIRRGRTASFEGLRTLYYTGPQLGENSSRPCGPFAAIFVFSIGCSTVQSEECHFECPDHHFPRLLTQVSPSPLAVCQER